MNAAPNRRFLFITSVRPHPTNVGGYQRSNLLYRAVKNLGDVDFLYIANPNSLTPEEHEQFKRDFNMVACIRPTKRGKYPPWKLLRPLAPRLIDKIAHNFGARAVDYADDPAIAHWLHDRLNTHQYDAIVSRYVKVTARSGALNYAPVLIDVDDLESRVYESRAVAPNTTNFQRWIFKRHLKQLNKILPEKLKQTHTQWLTNEADHNFPGMTNPHVLPNIPFIAKGATEIQPFPENQTSKTIMTLGHMGYYANREGVDYFVDNAWPLVLKQVPDAKLRIVGKDMPEAFRNKWANTSGVDPAGFVESIKDEYENCAFTLNAMYAGSGTNIKVLESLAFGRTCVVSEYGHRGYERLLPDNQAMLVAHSPEEMAQACITLLNDPAKRATLAATGREGVNAHFSFQRFCNIVKEDIEQAITSHAHVKSR